MDEKMFENTTPQNRVVITGGMPVTSAPGDSSRLAKEYYESLLIKMQYLDATKPDTTYRLYDETFSSPVSVSALSHMGRLDNGTLALAAIAKASAELNIPNFMGAGDMSEVDELLATGAKVIKIIKPYADHDLIYKEMEYAEKAGCFAVGMDIDHIYYGKNFYANVDGIPLGDVSTSNLAEYIKSSKLPFIVKGVLCAEDAKKCVDAGASGLFVSHHHGLFKYMTPPAMMLPDVASMVKASGKDIPVFIDGNIESGYSAFKALALGADCVSIGRPLMKPVREGGTDAVKKWLEKLMNELAITMTHSCCRTIDEITIDHIIKAEHRF